MRATVAVGLAEETGELEELGWRRSGRRLILRARLLGGPRSDWVVRALKDNGWIAPDLEPTWPFEFEIDMRMNHAELPFMERWEMIRVAAAEIGWVQESLLLLNMWWGRNLCLRKISLKSQRWYLRRRMSTEAYREVIRALPHDERGRVELHAVVVALRARRVSDGAKKP